MKTRSLLTIAIAALVLMGCNRKGATDENSTLSIVLPQSSSSVHQHNIQLPTAVSASAYTGLIENSLTSYADANCYAILIGGGTYGTGSTCKSVAGTTVASYGQISGFKPISDSTNIDATTGQSLNLYIVVAKSTDASCKDMSQMDSTYYRPYLAGAQSVTVHSGDNAVNINLRAIADSAHLDTCTSLPNLKHRAYQMSSPSILAAPINMNAPAVGSAVSSSFTSLGQSFSAFNSIPFSSASFHLDGSQYITSSGSQNFASGFTFSTVYQYVNLGATIAAFFSNSNNDVNIYWQDLTSTPSPTEVLQVVVGGQTWSYQGQMPRTQSSLIVGYDGTQVRAWVDGVEVTMVPTGSVSAPTSGQALFGFAGSIGFTGSLFETSVMANLSDQNIQRLVCYFGQTYTSMTQTANCY